MQTGPSHNTGKWKTLYEEQTIATDLLLGDAPQRWRSVVLPTGAGKTAVVQTAATLAAGRGRRVVVGTSLTNIRSALLTPDVLQYGARTVSTTDVPWNVVSSRKGLVEALARPGGWVLVATHALLAQNIDLFGDDMTDWTVVLDEAHHAGDATETGDQGGTLLYALAHRCLLRGGTVWGVTATPFRADGRNVHVSDVATYAVAYSDLALKGVLPKRVRVRTLAAPTSEGKALGPATFAAIATYCKAEGRPTVIRIPPGSAEGSSSALSKQMVAALVRAGYTPERILNVVGDGSEVAERLRVALDSERAIAAGAGYRKRQYDVIVSCGRLREGADWPFCSHVVLVGLPTSLVAALQLAGRGSRNKHRIKSYPLAWRDDVLVTGFVPEVSLDADDQTRRALLLAAAIECDEVVLDYRRFWTRLVRGFRLPPIVRGVHKDTFVEHLTGDAEERATASALVLAAHTDFVDTQNRAPTAAELWAKLDRWADDRTAPVRKSLVAQALVQAAHDPKLTEAFGTVYGVQFEAASTTPPAADDAPLRAWDRAFEDRLATAFTEVAAAFPTLALSGSYRGLSGVEAALTSDVLRSAVRKLAAERNAALSYTDREIVEALPDPRLFPSTPDADLSKHFGRRTRAVDVRNHLLRTDFDLDRLRLCSLWATQKLCEHPVLGAPVDPEAVRRAVKTARASRRPTFVALADTARSARSAEVAAAHRDSYVMVSGRKESLVGLFWAASRGWRGVPSDLFSTMT